MLTEGNEIEDIQRSTERQRPRRRQQSIIRKKEVEVSARKIQVGSRADPLLRMAFRAKSEFSLLYVGNTSSMLEVIVLFTQSSSTMWL